MRELLRKIARNQRGFKENSELVFARFPVTLLNPRERIGRDEAPDADGVTFVLRKRSLDVLLLSSQLTQRRSFRAELDPWDHEQERRTGFQLMDQLDVLFVAATPGVNPRDALLATLTYRLVSYWLQIPARGVAYVAFRRRQSASGRAET